MLTAIVIDDEINGRIALKQKLHDYCPTVIVVGEAENGREGIAMIQMHQPQLVFLDIEMPEMDGFTMLTNITEKKFHLVFTTAYDQYAIAAFEKNAAELHEVFDAEKEKYNTALEQEMIDRIYPLCTNISIDYAVMEKADNVYVMPSSFGWSDLGTWASAYDIFERDYLGNAVGGSDVMIIDATKNMVQVPHKKLVVLQGLDDFIVVDTKDVLLICKKDKEQEIKNYVAEVKRNKGEKYI